MYHITQLKVQLLHFKLLQFNLLFHIGVTKLHQRSDGSRSRVELTNFIFLNNLPESARVGIERSALKLFNETTITTSQVAGNCIRFYLPNTYYQHM